LLIQIVCESFAWFGGTGLLREQTLSTGVRPLERVKGNLMNAPDTSPLETWPDLPLDAWKETYATLHMWTRIVGKIRLMQYTWVNHSWLAVARFSIFKNTDRRVRLNNC